MKDLTDHALNIAKLEGARYADIRIVDRREQVVSVKNGNVDGRAKEYLKRLHLHHKIKINDGALFIHINNE